MTEDAKLTAYIKLYAVNESGGETNDCTDTNSDKIEIVFNNAIKKYNSYTDAKTAMAENENEINDLLLPSSSTAT